MPVLSIHDPAYPDDAYTRWRIAEIAAHVAEELRYAPRLPLCPEDQAEQLSLFQEVAETPAR